MSREYAEQRIREALKIHKGNATKTRQQIAAWSSEDARLLQALASPHLTGIIAYAVNRVITHMDDAPESVTVPDMPERLDMAPETFGREILKALSSSNTPVFGRDGGATPARKQASQSHIDAMKNIASKKKADE
jgi:hypothetical protein